MKPVLQALVLAERIYSDAQTNKKVICGTFNQLVVGMVQLVAQKPDGSIVNLIPGGTDMGSPSVFISLTDVVDGTEIALQFVNQTKNIVLLQTGFKLQVKDRLQTIEIVAPLPSMSQIVKETGIYSLDILCEGEILGSHRLVVRNLNE